MKQAGVDDLLVYCIKRKEVLVLNAGNISK
jgi:hypothetical protein